MPHMDFNVQCYQLTFQVKRHCFLIWLNVSATSKLSHFTKLNSTCVILKLKSLMAIVGLAIESQSGNKDGRVTLYVVLSCIMAAMGGVIFGYDIGITGGVTSMEPFLKKFFHSIYNKMKAEEDVTVSNYCMFDSQLLTTFTSSLYVAGLVTSFFASYITRAFGRKPSIIAGAAAFLVGTALGGAAFNVYMLIVGRLMLGVGVGFANQVR